MLQPPLIEGPTSHSQGGDGAIKIHGVPKNDRCDAEVETTGTMSLRLVGAVSQFAQTIETDGPREIILQFSFV